VGGISWGLNELLPRNLSGRIKEYDEKPWSDWLVPRPRFETKTFRIKSRSITAWDNFPGSGMLLSFQYILIMLHFCSIYYFHITIFFLFCWLHVKTQHLSKIPVFWDVILCSLVAVYRRLVSTFNVNFLIYYNSYTLKMEAAPPSATLVKLSDTSSDFILKDSKFSSHRRENFKIGEKILSFISFFKKIK
jgi:hypothetical protein